MSPQEELVLKILSSVDAVRGKTKFVKILHFVCKLLEKHGVKSPFQFEADQYGVFSNGLEPVLENLESERHIQISEDPTSGRVDLSAIDRDQIVYGEEISNLSSKIEELVKTLNRYSSSEILAHSYYLFPETTVNSKIKPEINKKIIELFSPLSQAFDEVEEEKALAIPASDVKALYPQFNDLDARVEIMKSLGLKELPPILPSIIDDSTGFIVKKYPLFKKYNLEEMLENARRR